MAREAGKAGAGRAGAASEEGGAGGSPALMTPAELKPLLKLARRRPVSFAVALTRQREAALLLHRRLKPRKLFAELKQRARAAGLSLDLATIRFGRTTVDGGSDNGKVLFTVNRDAPASMQMLLLPQLRPAGFQRCEFLTDTALEDEPEDGEDPDDADEDEHGEAGAQRDTAADATPAVAGAPAPPGPSGPGAADAGSPLGSTGAPTTRGLGPDPVAPTVAPMGATGPRRALPDARLSHLARRAAGMVGADPALAGPVRTAAAAARAAMTSGDPAAMGRAADGLERLLAGAGSGASPAPSGSGPSPPVPAGMPDIPPGGPPPASAAVDAPVAAGPGAAAERSGGTGGAAEPAATASAPPHEGRPGTAASPGRRGAVVDKGRAAWLEPFPHACER